MNWHYAKVKEDLRLKDNETKEIFFIPKGTIVEAYNSEHGPAIKAYGRTRLFMKDTYDSILTPLE